MTYRQSTDQIGYPRITDIGFTGPKSPITIGTIVRATDNTYGEGAFIWLFGVASLVVGDVVSYNAYTGITTRWAGTALTGSPLAVAMVANTSSTLGSWFQIQGNAVLTTSGTVAAGDGCYFNATGSVKSAAVAGKQVVNAVAATANGVPAANQAVYTIAYPFAQGAIT